MEEFSNEAALLVLNSHASAPTYCSDAGHASVDKHWRSIPWCDFDVFEWAVWEDIEIFYDH